MIEFILNQPLFIILVFSVLGIWVGQWHYAPRTSTKLSNHINPQKIAALEYNLELTTAGRTDATDRIIDDIDKQLAEMGVLEAQIACAEKKIRIASGIQPRCIGGSSAGPGFMGDTFEGKSITYHPYKGMTMAYVARESQYRGSSYDTMKTYVWDCNGPRNYIQPMDEPYPVEVISYTDSSRRMLGEIKRPTDLDEEFMGNLTKAEVDKIYDKAFPGTVSTKHRYKIK
jgi:hypothetical protein